MCIETPTSVLPFSTLLALSFKCAKLIDFTQRDADEPRVYSIGFCMEPCYITSMYCSIGHIGHVLQNVRVSFIALVRQLCNSAKVTGHWCADMTELISIGTV